MWNKNKVPKILEVQNQKWCTCTAAIIIPLIHNVPHLSVCGFCILFHLWQLFKPHIFYPRMQYVCLIWRHMAWRSFTFRDVWLGSVLKCKWRWHSTSISIFTHSSMDKAGDQYSQDIKYVCQFESWYGCRFFRHAVCAQILNLNFAVISISYT